jgi:hypothetical protein
MFMRGHRVLTLAAVENDVDLAAKAQVGTLSESLTVTVLNTANKGASNAATPAMRTGLNWKPGTFLFVKNTAVITGAVGNQGTPGAPGPTGPIGTGGAGGKGRSRGGALTGQNGSSGGNGGPGGTGGNGGVGGNGGTAFQADTVPGVRIVVDNTGGTFTAGAPGPAGTAGPVGQGGPGGGGGGGGGGAV